jgi:hypothetical protein
MFEHDVKLVPNQTKIDEHANIEQIKDSSSDKFEDALPKVILLVLRINFRFRRIMHYWSVCFVLFQMTIKIRLLSKTPVTKRTPVGFFFIMNISYMSL